MRLVFSTWLEQAQFDSLTKRGARKRLLSFGIVGSPTGKQRNTWEDYMKGTDLELMLDSGAYTAWKQGTPIKLQDYIAFIEKYKDAWTTVVNLDVIPGKPNKAPTSAEAERAADEGWDNYYQLRDALKPYGIVPIHVFHRGDDFKHLRRLVDECEYFGLAPKTDGTTEQRRAWLEDCMPYVTDAKGFATRKLHGFAVTALDLMRRYPWYSVDSTSWIMMGRFGGCFTRLPGRDEFKVAFSAKSPKVKQEGEHFDTLPPMVQAQLREYLLAHGLMHDPDRRWFNDKLLRDDFCLTCGKPWEDKDGATCCAEPVENTAYIKRDEMNIDYFLEEEENAPEELAWKRLGGLSLF